MDEKWNVQQMSASPMPSDCPPPSVPLPNSSQNISSPLETPNESAAVCFHSASSPKLAVFNNNDQQRCSPSVISSNSKKVLSRSGTPSSSNASLHLKIDTPKSAAGDVYEFHSSPEEDNIQTSSSGFFFSSAPNAGGILQSKEGYQPPQKRIKTAILAKKLLAAAADSNLIDAIGVGGQMTNGNCTPNKTTAVDEQFGSESGGAILEDGQKESDAMGEGPFEEDEDEAAEEEEGEDEQRGHEEEAPADVATSAVVQEQKKVPPLRISLLKTPSEEGMEASSAQTSPPLRRNKGASRVGGRRQAGHGAKKDDLQRITRSRVRQIATNPIAAEGIPLLGRKRRFRPTMAGSGGDGLLEEEEETSGTVEAEESGEAENAAEEDEQRNSNNNNEDRRSEGDLRGGNRTNNGGAIQAQPDAAPPQQRLLSLAASVLSKNSLEQSVIFEAMIRERWSLHYKEYLRRVTDRMERANLSSPQTEQAKEVEPKFFGSDVTKEWPEVLQKLYSEQTNRSREMTEAHRRDRERIRTMMRREMEKAKGRPKATDSEQQTPFITAVSILRDSECYDPTVFAAETPTSKKVQMPSLAQLQHRFNYLVNTTKNRHAMEAHTLGENHKSEWNRALRRIARENERQQMLKGTAGGRQLTHLPMECCSESVVPTVQLVDIPLGSFQNEE